MSQVGRVKITLFRTQFLFHHLTHLLTFHMNSRKHNMARLQMHKLENTLTQVAFYHINASFSQERLHLALFGEHGFALNQILRVVLL